MIYCVWYPSGGFGHFINSVLSTHGKNFVRPVNKTIEFSKNGNAHSVELVAPKYQHDSKYYNFNPKQRTKNYSVLIDNGINNEGEKFRDSFPNAEVIKICYSDKSWPIVARTMIDKAMNSSLTEQLSLDQDLWSQDTKWSQREKYFLFLRDHHLRKQWKPSTHAYNIFIEDMLTYVSMTRVLLKANIRTNEFNDLWNRWYAANYLYIRPIVSAQEIIKDIKQGNNKSLAEITDVWEQAVIYYFLWVEFNQEVPHNDYADFFNETDTIKAWLRL